MPNLGAQPLIRQKKTAKLKKRTATGNDKGSIQEGLTGKSQVPEVAIRSPVSKQLNNFTWNPGLEIKERPTPAERVHSIAFCVCNLSCIHQAFEVTIHKGCVNRNNRTFEESTEGWGVRWSWNYLTHQFKSPNRA